MATDEERIRSKMNLLDLAAYLKNVSEACRVMGTSRDTFYRAEKAYESGGLKALKVKSRRKPSTRNRISEKVETTVVAFALEELQQDLDHWLERYNNHRTDQEKRCNGRIPMETFEENLNLAKERRSRV